MGPVSRLGHPGERTDDKQAEMITPDSPGSLHKPGRRGHGTGWTELKQRGDLPHCPRKAHGGQGRWAGAVTESRVPEKGIPGLQDKECAQQRGAEG